MTLKPIPILSANTVTDTELGSQTSWYQRHLGTTKVILLQCTILHFSYGNVE